MSKLWDEYRAWEGERDSLAGREGGVDHASPGEWAASDDGAVDLMRRMAEDTLAMDRLHGLLAGTEWDSGTLEGVAVIVETTGRLVTDPNEPEGGVIKFAPGEVYLDQSTGTLHRHDGSDQ